LLAGVRLDGAMPQPVLSGRIGAEYFDNYVDQYIAPELKRGDIVMMEQAKPRKGTRVAEAIQKAGCTLVYLPPYSPDFNPIENLWSKVKASLRKTCARTFDALVDAVRDALLAVTPEDCDGFFEHCGYVGTPT